MRSATTREPVLPVEPSTSVGGSSFVHDIDYAITCESIQCFISSFYNVILSICGPIA